MKFNLDIVQSYIRAYAPYSNFNHPTELNLSSICTELPSDTKNHEALYILDAQDILNNPDTSFGNTSLLILNAGPQSQVKRNIHCVHAFFEEIVTLSPHDSTTSNKAKHCRQERPLQNLPLSQSTKHWSQLLPSTCHYVALETPADSASVMIDVIRMLTDINDWSSTLMAMLTNKMPLPDVFNYAQTIFKNPLMLSDSAMCFWSLAGDLPTTFYDTLWTPALTQGYCPLENYYHIWCKSNENPFSYNKAFIVDGSPHSQHHYLFRNLSYAEKYYGSFELIDTFEPFTRADIALANYLGEIVCAALAHTYDIAGTSSKNPLQDLLHGEDIREDFINVALNTLGWSHQDLYRVVLFEQQGIFESQGTAQQQCRTRIQNAYPKALIFTEPKGFCAIIRQTDYPWTNVEETEKKIAQLFSHPYKIAIGVSSTLSGFKHLASGLKQAQFAIRFSNEACQQSTTSHICLSFFDDYYLDAFVETFAKSEFFMLLDVAPLHVLIKSDLTNQTEYLDTIIAFFENGFNIHHTAEALHIHRNTLSYRLKRIKHLSGIDCENPAESCVDPLRVYIACRAQKTHLINDFAM